MVGRAILSPPAQNAEHGNRAKQPYAEGRNEHHRSSRIWKTPRRKQLDGYRSDKHSYCTDVNQG